MNTSGGRKVEINKGYEIDELAREEPVHLKAFRSNFQEYNSHTDDLWNPVNESLEEKPKPAKSSHGKLFVLVILACLISIVALILTLLTVSRKIGEKFECPANKGWS